MVALSLAAVVVLCLPVVALVTGIYVYGWGRLRLPATDAALPDGAALTRMLIIVAFILVSELVTAALAFWLSAPRTRRSARSAARSA